MSEVNLFMKELRELCDKHNAYIGGNYECGIDISVVDVNITNYETLGDIQQNDFYYDDGTKVDFDK